MHTLKQRLFIVAALLIIATRTAAPEGKTQSKTPPHATTRLFFSVQWKDSARAYAQIYAMKSDGTNRVCLTPTLDAEYRPALSPDGKTVAFTTHRDGKRSLYLMNPDGTNPRRVLWDHDAGLCAWSPDGKQLAFSSNSTGRYCIWVMNVDGTNPRRLTSGPSEDCPTWSPDGRKIVFQSRENNIWRVCVVNANGWNRQAITTEKWDSRWPQWSPDGRLIAYTGYEQGNGDIYTMRPDGTQATRQTDNPGEDRQPAWDGAQLLFHSNRAGHFDIYALALNSHNEHRLTAETKDTAEVTAAPVSVALAPRPTPRATRPDRE